MHYRTPFFPINVKITLMKSLKLFLLLLVSGFFSFNLTAQIDEPSISASNFEIGTIIDWTIGKENDELHFIVEKSSNGIKFFPIFDCASKDCASKESSLDFSFLDIDTKEKTAYYRIKQMTKDGTFNYSETTQVQVTYKNNLVINSITDLGNIQNRGPISINLEVDQNGELIYSIEDMEQVVLMSGTQNLVVGNNELSLDFSLFPLGEYAVKMQYGDEMEVLLLEKQEDLFRLEADIMNRRLGELVRKQ